MHDEKVGPSRLSRQAALFGALLVFAIVLASVASILVSREREIDTWRRQLDSMSLMLTEHTAQIVSSAYLALDTIADRAKLTGAQDEATFRKKVATVEFFERMNEKIHGLPQVDVATIVAADGRVLNFTRSFPPPTISLADRDYFIAQRDRSQTANYMSLPVRNKGTGKWTFYISRRLDDAQGKLLGMVLVGLSVDAFVDYFDRVAQNLGEGASINLFRSDLTLLARSPRSDDLIGTVARSGAAHAVVVEQKKANAVVLVDSKRLSDGDAVLRLGAVRATDSYPLVTSLVVTSDLFLASWRRTTWLIAGVSGVSIVLLLLGIGVLVNNLKRRERAEAELRSREMHILGEQQRLQALLRTASDGIHILDEQGLLTMASETFLDMLGYPASAVGTARVDQWDAQDPLEIILYRNAELIARQGRAVFETRHRRSDGRVLDVEISVSGIQIDGKGYLYAASRDVSERKQKEEALRLAMQAAQAANVAKSRFLATMSHEIRTPMNGILGMAQLLLMPGLQEQERHDYAQVIKNSGQSLLGLLNDILDLSKVEAGKLELEALPFSPRQLLQETTALFSAQASAKGLTLAPAWQGPQDARYLGDPARLRQMLSNLLGNAIKFTAQGTVHVQARVLEAGSAAQQLEFSVTDTGIGIAPEKQALLFNPFTQVDASDTRKYGGSGLGLSIVRSLARQMHGDVGVSSTENQGSRFWFSVQAPSAPAALQEPESEVFLPTPTPTPSVPAASASAALAAAPLLSAERVPAADAAPAQVPALESSPAQGAASTSALVLVVEDNAINRAVIEALLKRLAVRYVCVVNGALAVQAVMAKLAPALIFMDCQMPVMDGFEATQRIRQWERDSGAARVPIVALTAGAFAEDRARCLAVGMDDFLTKPIDLALLRRTLDQWAGASRAAGGGSQPPAQAA